MVKDATYEGSVVNRDDPEGLGRIKVLVPGILEPESDWIRPMCTFGGSKQRGIFAVPKIDPEGGANVDVVFLHGDTHYPRYVAGPWGRPGGVSDVPDQAPLGNPDIVVMRFGDAAIVIDERTGQRKMTLLDIATNSSLKLDIETGKVDLTANSTLTLDGTPDIKGGAAATAFVVLATIKTWLETHTHLGVQTGSGISGPPDPLNPTAPVPIPGTEFSTKFKAE